MIGGIIKLGHKSMTCESECESEKIQEMQEVKIDGSLFTREF